MSQLFWTLLDDTGQQYEVGLYHGDRSKHVLIHINRKPVVIDFNIRKDKTYSFYVGEELCEMNVIKNQNTYQYSFVTNHKINTPLNNARKRQARKYFLISMILFLVILILVLGLSYWYMNMPSL